MLGQRIITACILIAVFLLANFVLPPYVFVLLISLLCLTGAQEWARLGGLEQSLHKVIYVTGMLLLLVTAYFFKDRWGLAIIVFGALWWGFRFVLLVTDRQTNRKDSILLSGYWVLLVAWLCLALLHQISPSILLAGLVLVWGADSFAYFAGKKFGKTKLAPKISPGKTREGVLGGTLGVLVLALISAYLIDLPKDKWIYWLLGAAFISLISVVGDLYESWLKRNVGIKDSGTIFPGHGGVLDRIDGVVAAMPFYYLLVNWLVNG